MKWLGLTTSDWKNVGLMRGTETRPALSAGPSFSIDRILHIILYFFLLQ